MSKDAAKAAAAALWQLSDDELTDLMRAAHRLEVTAGLLQARLFGEFSARGVPAAQAIGAPPGSWRGDRFCGKRC